jgi:formylglycine-generating enzyme required for sulfatase activity
MISVRLGITPLFTAMLGCSGPSFVAADVPDAGETGGAGGGATADTRIEDAALGSDASVLVNDASVPGSDASTSACGPLRSGDAPRYDRELCFAPSRFTMGSSASNLGGLFADHTPPHPVALRGFVLDAYEVTVGRYRLCVEAGACAAPPPATGCNYQSGHGSQPITCVSWEEAKKFCAWDGARRLPSEAQWERAARGPSISDYPWGQRFDCRHAVLGGANGCPEHAGELPKPVGPTPEGASPEGAFDLAGNVAEWVADWVASYPSSEVTDPAGAPAGSQRVVRGGAWRSLPEHGMGYVRFTATPDSRGPWGMRCAREY